MQTGNFGVEFRRRQASGQGVQRGLPNLAPARHGTLFWAVSIAADLEEGHVSMHSLLGPKVKSVYQN